MLLFARQHGESQTRILYSRALIMLVTVALAVVPLVGATALAKHDVCLAWLDESMFVLLDVILACAMLYSIGGPYLYYSLFTSAARPELTALRAVSSLVVTACVLTIVVTLLPRPVLFAGAVLTHAVFLNTTSWVTSVALRLQTDGLAPLLPKTVDAVLSTPPLELLNRTTGSPAAVQRLVRTARQVAALCLLSEEDQQEALELLPLALRAKLQRSLASELPSPLQQLLSPWAEGSNYLRVDELTIAQTAALADPRKQTLFFSLPEHVEQAVQSEMHAEMHAGGDGAGGDGGGGGDDDEYDEEDDQDADSPYVEFGARRIRRRRPTNDREASQDPAESEFGGSAITGFSDDEDPLTPLSPLPAGASASASAVHAGLTAAAAAAKIARLAVRVRARRRRAAQREQRERERQRDKPPAKQPKAPPTTEDDDPSLLLFALRRQLARSVRGRLDRGRAVAARRACGQTMQALQLVAEGVKGVTLGISYLPLAFGEWVRDNTVQVGRDLLAKAVPGPVKAVLASRETPMTPLQRSYEDLREFSQAVSFKAPSPAASSTDSSSPVHE